MDGVAVEDDVLLQQVAVIVLQAHADTHPLVHLGQVTNVVLGLDDEAPQRAHGPDVEHGQPQRPHDSELHGEGRFADAGLAHDDEAPSSAQPAVAQHIVGVVTGIVVPELGHP